RRERLGDFAEIRDGDALVRQIALGTAEDRQKLPGPGVTVLQAAVRHAAMVDAPAPADRRQSVRRRPTLFLQSIKRERTVLPGRAVGRLLHLEIFGLLFQFHGRVHCPSADRHRTDPNMDSRHARSPYNFSRGLSMTRLFSCAQLADY